MRTGPSSKVWVQVLQIDVFAGRQRIDRHANVPVIRRRDEDGINIARKHLVIVEVGRRTAIGTFFDGVAVWSIDVADGDDLVRANFVGGIEQVAHAAAGADDSDTEGVVCPRTRVEAIAVSPLAMMKLRRFSISMWPSSGLFRR